MYDSIFIEDTKLVINIRTFNVNIQNKQKVDLLAIHTNGYELYRATATQTLNYSLFYDSKTPIINSDVLKQKVIMLKRVRRLFVT